MKALFVLVVAVAAWLVPGAAWACGCCCEHGHEQHAATQRTPAATAQLAPREVRVKIPVAGMHCGHCASRVESALGAVDGVKHASASLEDAQAVVVFDKSKVTASKLVETVNVLGFKAGAPVQD